MPLLFTYFSSPPPSATATATATASSSVNMPRDHLPSLSALHAAHAHGQGQAHGQAHAPGHSHSMPSSPRSSPRDLHLSSLGPPPGSAHPHSIAAAAANAKAIAAGLTAAPGPPPAAVAHSKALDAHLQLQHQAPSCTPAFLSHGAPPRDAKRARTNTGEYVAGGGGAGGGEEGKPAMGFSVPGTPTTSVMGPGGGTTLVPESGQARYDGLSRRTSAMLDSWQLDDFSTESLVAALTSRGHAVELRERPPGTDGSLRGVHDVQLRHRFRHLLRSIAILRLMHGSPPNGAAVQQELERRDPRWRTRESVGDGKGMNLHGYMSRALQAGLRIAWTDNLGEVTADM